MTRASSLTSVCTPSDLTRAHLTLSVHSNIGTDPKTGIPPTEIPVHLRMILIAASDTTVSPVHPAA
jgi:hypothetical protein